MEEIRSRLVGTWALISLTVHPYSEPSQHQPLVSSEAKGFLIYSNDGFMTSLIHDPDGSNIYSYSGLVTVSEEGDRTIVSHHVKADVHVENIGTTQRRLPVFGEENGDEVLTLTTDGPVVNEGREMMVTVRWKRAKKVYKTTIR